MFQNVNEQFTVFLSRTLCDITKHITTFRQAVTPEEKLDICLRLLT